MLLDPHSWRGPAGISGAVGAVSSGHRLATAAGQLALFKGGGAADAMIAAQAVLCVAMPDACGVGGDGLATIREPSGRLVSYNGAGLSAAGNGTAAIADDGRSVTVPGLVRFWHDVSEAHGRLPLAETLAPAIALARRGIVRAPALLRAANEQRARLARGGAGDWSMVAPGGADDRVVQPDLANLLSRLGTDGPDAFYGGEVAEAIVRAVGGHGGTLAPADLALHETQIAAPLTLDWRGWRVAVQPPASQGVLLLMVLAAAERLDAGADRHALVELAKASFAHRDEVARGAELMDRLLEHDPERAAEGVGPRSYLHTAGVATADVEGTVCSSLVSVFDDFGSAILVPEHGFVLNNRAAGFTTGDNAPGGGKRPVHTLAPALVGTGDGAFAIATPGADGQVQVLLQVLHAIRVEGIDPAEAVARPRWRAEDGKLLVEEDMAGLEAFAARGHKVVPGRPGANPFGAVTIAGVLGDRAYALSDWRRQTTSGVA